jgi:hypothetical protein
MVSRATCSFRAGVKDRRPVAGADVVALAVAGGGIVDLEEEFQQVAKTDDAGIEHDFDRLGMVAMVAVGRILDLPAATRVEITPGLQADQILHSPETAAGENGAVRYWVS